MEKSDVEVIELMPPAVKTALSADLPQRRLVALITTDELLKQHYCTREWASSVP
jgi:uncharacterized oxidoreductase